MDNIIKTAVQDAIDVFIKSLERKDTVSPRIEGEIPDVSKYIRTFRNIDFLHKDDFILDEGLIKTYPIDKTIKYIVRKYGLRKEQVQRKPFNIGIMTVDFISVILPNSTDSNMLGDIKHDLKSCGYFNNQNPIPIRNTNYFAIVFEPKFTKNIAKMVREKYHYLYHSAPKIYLDKIIKNGLIPKSKNSLFFYPDRTFLMIGDNLSYGQCVMLKNVQTARNLHADTNNPNENKEYILITVDVSKLPKTIKFYCDPMANGAIFTYDKVMI